MDSRCLLIISVLGFLLLAGCTLSPHQALGCCKKDEAQSSGKCKYSDNGGAVDAVKIAKGLVNGQLFDASFCNLTTGYCNITLLD